MLPYLRQLPEGVYRELMFKDLAQRTGLELSSLMRLEAPPEPPPIAEPYEDDVNPEAPPPYADIDEPAPQPRKRTALSSASAGHDNLAQSALALLLHQPEIAQRADPASLGELEGADVSLLRELISLLRRRPESNTAMLLGHWYGTEEGELLNRLAGQERLIPSEGIERQFLDTIAVLEELPHRRGLEAKVDKLRSTNYADLSELEKQQLREALQREAARKKR